MTTPEPPRLHLAPTPSDDNPTRPAEQAILGTLLTRPDLLDTLNLNPHDHHDPRHELIHHAITTLHTNGTTPDPVTVGDHLRTLKQIRRIGGQAYLHELLNHAAPYNLAHHAQIVTRHATRRRLTTALHAAAQQAADNIPIPDVLTRAREALDAATAAPTHGPALGEPIDTFLAHDDNDTPNWIIEGVLERQDRLIITAAEGAGKSTLLRQIAVQAAAGIHPFNDLHIPPIRTALLDLENSPRQVRRKIRPLAHRAGQERPQFDPANLIIHCRPEGLDLTQHDDRQLLDTFLTHHTPDLLILGPIYKLAGGNPNDEVDVKPAALYLDHLRTRHDVALILEAHSRKGENPRNRPKEPFGWSGWMRWPEFGIHISNDGTTSELTHWRGMRDERQFPTILNRGGKWPFIAGVSIEDQKFVTIKNAIRGAAKRLTARQIEEITGISKSTVDRILRDRKAELVVLYNEIGDSA